MDPPGRAKGSVGRQKRSRSEMPSFLQEAVWKVVDDQRTMPNGAAVPAKPQQPLRPEPVEQVDPEKQHNPDLVAHMENRRQSDAEIREMVRLLSEISPTVDEIQQEKRLKADAAAAEDEVQEEDVHEGHEGEEEEVVEDEEVEDDIVADQKQEWNAKEIRTLD